MTMKEKIMGLFGKALDEAMPDETAPPETKDEDQDVRELLAAVLSRLDALEGKSPAGDEDKDEDKRESADTSEETSTERNEGEDADNEDASAAEDEDEGTSAEPPSVEQRLAAIESALAKLLDMERAEAASADSDDEHDKDTTDNEQGNEFKDEDASEASTAHDAETVSRAEILAPGIRKSGDIKTRALNQAYATDDGKALINKILAGKPFKSADTNTLFMAASEMLKSQRRSLMAPRIAVDALPSIKSTAMTPEKLNALNAARYGRQP